MIPWSLVALGAVVAAAALWLLLRARRESARLQGRLQTANEELQRLQQSFSRFAPEAVVEEIIARGVSTQAERKEVTALFADLVEYTALAEQVEPRVLMRILNGYFERMSRAITDHRGYVSTFIGDGVLAMFGAFEPNPWQSDDAVHCALAMRAELAEYNRELDAEGLPGLAIGVGVHRGVGVAGLVGSRDLMQYAFVGRTVNVASRVQGLTRSSDTDILITADVREKLDPRFRVRPLPKVEVKGVAEPVTPFAVDGYEAPQ